eukprot:m.151602 g.151602  ORF g.151602 m.151602 type:complete len:179 (-) comp17415_c0_seq1:247-783(-)
MSWSVWGVLSPWAGADAGQEESSPMPAAGTTLGGPSPTAPSQTVGDDWIQLECSGDEYEDVDVRALPAEIRELGAQPWEFELVQDQGDGNKVDGGHAGGAMVRRKVGGTVSMQKRQAHHQVAKAGGAVAAAALRGAEFHVERSAKARRNKSRRRRKHPHHAVPRTKMQPRDVHHFHQV